MVSQMDVTVTAEIYNAWRINDCIGPAPLYPSSGELY